MTKAGDNDLGRAWSRGVGIGLGTGWGRGEQEGSSGGNRLEWNRAEITENTKITFWMTNLVTLDHLPGLLSKRKWKNGTIVKRYQTPGREEEGQWEALCSRWISLPAAPPVSFEHLTWPWPGGFHAQVSQKSNPLPRAARVWQTPPATATRNFLQEPVWTLGGALKAEMKQSSWAEKGKSGNSL